MDDLREAANAVGLSLHEAAAIALCVAALAVLFLLSRIVPDVGKDKTSEEMVDYERTTGLFD